jgi:hypothetical protein
VWLEMARAEQRIASAQIREDPFYSISDEHDVEVEALRLVEGCDSDSVMLVCLVRQERACFELLGLDVRLVLEQGALGIAFVPPFDDLGE